MRIKVFLTGLQILATALIFQNISAQTISDRIYKLSETEAKSIVENVLKTAPIIDGHNDLFVHYFDCETCPRGLEAYPLDTITKGQTDIPRWRKGGLGGQLLNIFGTELTEASYLQAWELLHQIEKTYPSDIKIVGTAAEIRKAMKQGRIAILPSLEGAVRIQDDPSSLSRYYKLGLRSVTFAYKTNKLADGSEDEPTHNGISEQGRQMVKEMNKLGVLIDISHISAKAMSDILDVTSAPVIFSHSNARALCDVNRNVPDSILKRLQINKGIIMLTFVPYFTKPEFNDWLTKGDTVFYAAKDRFPDNRDSINAIIDKWEAENPQPLVTVKDIADHFDYVRQLVGVDYIGMAGDYDGIEFTIKGMEDVSSYPKLLIELAKRGWNEEELKKITNENFLRVFEAVERKAKE